MCHAPSASSEGMTLDVSMEISRDTLFNSMPVV
jgi:hypothetical protein